jgi:predicted amidohydrolase YtcJ
MFTSCSKKPDILFTNGIIYSLDDDKMYESIAVKDGKIFDLGSTKELTEKYKDANKFDFKNHIVLPGFIDCEGSIIDFSQNLFSIVHLNNVDNISKLKNVLTEKLNKTDESNWILGTGWNFEKFSENEIMEIDRYFLDSISSKHMLCILDSTGTVLICNSNVINELKITNKTQSTPEGEIEVDENGELTGIFYDNAVKLVYEKSPELSREKLKKAIESGSNELLKYGITEIHDRNLGKDAINLIKELIDSNKFPIKIHCILTGDDEAFEEYLKKGIEINYGNKLTVRAVTVDYDGLFQNGTALMTDDYSKGSKNIPYIDDNKVESIMRKALENKFQFTIKATGDKAIENVLNICEKVIKSDNFQDHRTIIEEVEFTNQNDILRLKNLNIIPKIIPEICLEDLELLRSNNSNKNIIKKTALWNSIIKTSGKLISGTNFPINNINPFVQIYFLVSGKLDSANILINTDERITVNEAVNTFTKWAAYSGFEENSKGVLKIGSQADFIVISDDVFKIDINKIPYINIISTIINGIVTYNSLK